MKLALIDRKIVFFLLMFLMTIGLYACGFNPTEKDAATAIEKKFAGAIEKKFLKITKVTKTNGQEGSIASVKIYNMAVDVELEFLTDVVGCSIPAFLGEGLSGYLMKTISLKEYNNLDYWSKFSYAIGCTPTTYKKGAKNTIKATLIFEKSEKGWQVASIK